MKITVNLEEIYDEIGESYAKIIRDQIEYTLKSEVNKIAKQVFNEQRDNMIKAVSKLSTEQLAKLLNK